MLQHKRPKEQLVQGVHTTNPSFEIFFTLIFIPTLFSLLGLFFFTSFLLLCSQPVIGLKLYA